MWKSCSCAVHSAFKIYIQYFISFVLRYRRKKVDIRNSCIIYEKIELSDSIKCFFYSINVRNIEADRFSTYVLCDFLCFFS